MENSTTIGLNRTGAHMSRFQVGEMKDAVEEFEPTSSGDETQIAQLRSEYFADASRIGSVPIPGTLSGMVQTGIEKLTGDNPEVLIDKLGERLAFERTGTRLYEALIAKLEVGSDEPVSVPLDEVRRFHDEEVRHFRMVASALESLGADPTAQTPCADVTGVASGGLLQVLTDPRTDVTQCLNAILIAELTDNAGWELLISLSEKMGKDSMAQDFRIALDEENIHLQSVRQWLEDAVLAKSS